MTEELRKAFLDAAALVRKGWVQGMFAQDAEKMLVPSLSDRACAWCISGALNRVASGELRGEMERLCSEVALASGYEHIIHWNDDPERTQSEVVALLERLAAA